jgi:mannose-6-phosphate isomerase
MGTYPTTPSLVLATGEDLQKHINVKKEKLIGKSILNEFGADLPYLPKVNFVRILSFQNTPPTS